MTLNWAIHRLSGVSMPASALLTADELTHQLLISKAKVIFTVASLLETAVESARRCGIPQKRIYICDMADDDDDRTSNFTKLSTLFHRGRLIPELEAKIWNPGQSEKQVAFMCFSSGTSGLPVRGRSEEM